MKRLKLLAIYATVSLFVLGSIVGGVVYAKNTPPKNHKTEVQETKKKTDADYREVEEKDANEKPENESATEAAEKEKDETKNEEKEDKNLPGGGHQDPEGTNVDHQAVGIE